VNILLDLLFSSIFLALKLKSTIGNRLPETNALINYQCITCPLYVRGSDKIEMLLTAILGLLFEIYTTEG
jgi:hypothetical protein